jgi:leucyl-tRNA synthetase
VLADAEAMAPTGTAVDREGLEGPEAELFRKTHDTIRRVNSDLDRFHMNTAIAALMELSNGLSLALQDPAFRPAPDRPAGAVLRHAAESLLVLLAPMAPFITEELWSRLGHSGSIFRTPVPTHDPEAIRVESAVVVVQIAGKVRARLEVPLGLDRDTILARALEDENVSRHLGGKDPRKVIYVPDKLLNLVPA